MLQQPDAWETQTSSSSSSSSSFFWLDSIRSVILDTERYLQSQLSKIEKQNKQTWICSIIIGILLIFVLVFGVSFIFFGCRRFQQNLVTKKN